MSPRHDRRNQEIAFAVGLDFDDHVRGRVGESTFAPTIAFPPPPTTCPLTAEFCAYAFSPTKGNRR